MEFKITGVNSEVVCYFEITYVAVNDGMITFRIPGVTSKFTTKNQQALEDLMAVMRDTYNTPDWDSIPINVESDLFPERNYLIIFANHIMSLYEQGKEVVRRTYSTFSKC